MSKIYLKLANAPGKYWERDGVLRFEAESGEEKPVNAWTQLCEVTGVASATASKALRWMHEQGVIGYFAGKNGAGIRIFLNRASSSIGTRKGQADEKILSFPHTSFDEARASTGEAAFSDSYAVLESSDTDRSPRAPKNGAEQTEVVKTPPTLQPVHSENPPQYIHSGSVLMQQTALRVEVPVEVIVSRLRRELEPSLQSAAQRAAAREHERTREWLESRGLPKAARVAQREAYNVLRKYGVVKDTARASNAGTGRSEYTPTAPQALSEDEVIELAQACVAMLEVKGQSVEVTVSEMCAEAGGFLLPEDAPRVRAKAKAILGDHLSMTDETG
jgi:hypothetical protein